MGFCCPSTLEATGSDPHRVCLSRLCCAFRLSQPPDALFLPQPSGFVSRRWRPWAFALQRFAPPPRPASPLGGSSPPGVARTSARLGYPDDIGRSPGCGHPGPGSVEPFVVRSLPSSSADQGVRRCLAAKPAGRTGAHLQGIEPCGSPCVHPPGVTQNGWSRSSPGFSSP
jgi:hypothetical protein